MRLYHFKIKLIILRLVLLFVFIGFSLFGNAQTKKEQIQILNKRVDSLSEILGSERKINLDKSTKISELTNTISNLESSISSLKANMIKLTVESQSKITEIINLQAILKIKSDSLSLVIDELDKLKNQKLIYESSLNSGSIDDLVIEGKTYKTVKIGNQTWMAENLNVSTFRNGDQIFEVKSFEEWENAGDEKRPAWCYYNNNPKNGSIYGKLYNYFAVIDPRGLAPEGWHIPSTIEWDIFINSLGGKEKAVKIMIESSAWNSNFKNSYNLQFNAMPGGLRDIGIKGSKGDFSKLKLNSYWWSSTVNDEYSAEYISLDIQYPVQFGWHYNSVGMSIRCVKD
jgi:uncharacterized protein (TIGR02145 family)